MQAIPSYRSLGLFAKGLQNTLLHPISIGGACVTGFVCKSDNSKISKACLTTAYALFASVLIMIPYMEASPNHDEDANSLWSFCSNKFLDLYRSESNSSSVRKFTNLANPAIKKFDFPRDNLTDEQKNLLAVYDPSNFKERYPKETQNNYLELGERVHRKLWEQDNNSNMEFILHIFNRYIDDHIHDLAVDLKDKKLTWLPEDFQNNFKEGGFLHLMKIVQKLSTDENFDVNNVYYNITQGSKIETSNPNRGNTNQDEDSSKVSEAKRRLLIYSIVEKFKKLNGGDKEFFRFFIGNPELFLFKREYRYRKQAFEEIQKEFSERLKSKTLKQIEDSLTKTVRDQIINFSYGNSSPSLGMADALHARSLNLLPE